MRGNSSFPRRRTQAPWSPLNLNDRHGTHNASKPRKTCTQGRMGGCGRAPARTPEDPGTRPRSAPESLEDFGFPIAPGARISKARRPRTSRPPRSARVCCVDDARQLAHRTCSTSRTCNSAVFDGRCRNRTHHGDTPCKTRYTVACTLSPIVGAQRSAGVRSHCRGPAP
jgi:hypothetical protein